MFLRIILPFLFYGLCPLAYADEIESSDFPKRPETSRFIDELDLLDDIEEFEFSSKSKALKSDYNVDFFLYTRKSIPANPSEFAAQIQKEWCESPLAILVYQDSGNQLQVVYNKHDKKHFGGASLDIIVSNSISLANRFPTSTGKLQFILSQLADDIRYLASRNVDIQNKEHQLNVQSIRLKEKNKKRATIRKWIFTGLTSFITLSVLVLLFIRYLRNKPLYFNRIETEPRLGGPYSGGTVFFARHEPYDNY